MKGRLIVFEGADGSGKATQAKLLLDYLKKAKIPRESISFPRYKDSLWGKMVLRYLTGEFGKVNMVNPYLASVLYAGDRFSASNKLKKWIDQGKIVICDRYVGSNLAHMAAKIKDEGLRIKFIKWLEELEYGENQIPKEDLAIFLDVPVAISRKLMQGRKKDIHESDLNYLKRVVEVYQELAKLKKNWVKVSCVKNGQLLNPDKVHLLVLKILKERKLLSK